MTDKIRYIGVNDHEVDLFEGRYIVPKGMSRVIKEAYPGANIVAIDYDPGATKVNQENRIKLMLANAKKPAKY